MKSERIDKLFSSLGYGSRTEARKYARAGRITMADGSSVKDLSLKVNPNDLLIDGEPLESPGIVLILMNKPRGVVCSHSSSDGPRIYDLLPDLLQRRNPPLCTVGRLDKDTTGAILITDDTQLVHRLTAPRSKVEKSYLVTVDEVLDSAVLSAFETGTLMLENEETPCLPARWEIVSDHVCRVVIVEGRFHQVKRMFATVGYTVDKLHRESFAGLNTEGIELESYRDVDMSELAGALLK